MPVPVEKSNCYLRIKFPNDINLPDPENENEINVKYTTEVKLNMMSRKFYEIYEDDSSKRDLKSEITDRF